MEKIKTGKIEARRNGKRRQTAKEMKQEHNNLINWNSYVDL